MGISWAIARRVAAVAVIGAALTLLPINVEDAPLTIPDVIWNPLVSVLALDRYFPIRTGLLIFAANLGIQVAMAGLWLTSWLWSRIVGS